MKNRHISTKILEAAAKNPVITLTGPRQSGKTTLCKHLFKDHKYVSLEDPDKNKYALEDPKGFLKFYSKAVIDEAQKAPELFSYIQGIVDEKQEPGQFILTGSQNFLLMESIGQTLAGRAAIFNLLPFTLREILGKNPGNPFKAEYKETKLNMDLFEVIFKGFYPRIHDKNLNPTEWLSDYTQTYIERDVRSLINVSDLNTFRKFLSLCAGRNGQILDLENLGNDCGISHTTVRRWISLLETSFHIILLQPHHKNFNKRVIKRPKLYFLDTGLLCYLLGIGRPEDLINHNLRGFIFESLIISEYYKNFLNQKIIPPLYFWRDSQDHEVDLIIANGEKLIPIEIKSGETFNKEFVEDLTYFCNLSKDRESFLYFGGDESFTYKETKIISWQEL